eukprot:SAG11_NODE_4654_length_1820_cov_0.908193_5_plen_104_part_00
MCDALLSPLWQVDLSVIPVLGVIGAGGSLTLVRSRYLALWARPPVMQNADADAVLRDRRPFGRSSVRSVVRSFGRSVGRSVADWVHDDAAERGKEFARPSTSN